jgi:ribosomal protein S18 acetylase RimI-like enzyme
VEVRDCASDELLQVLSLWSAADAEPTVTDDVSALESLLAFAPNSLLVAVDTDAVVGTLICGWDGWRGAFYRLAVAPAFRRQGIATALVREGERRLLQAGARRIAVIAVESAPTAGPFWIAAGYIRQSDRIRLVKNLAE